MEERFSLADGRGVLTLREEGGRAVCGAELQDDGRGLYKAWLRGESGRVLLGTLIPEGGRLRLVRTLSIDELAGKGAWPVRGWEAELAFSPQRGQHAAPVPVGWTREGQPARLMGDRLLSRAAEGLTQALLQRADQGFRLAVPWEANRAVPLAPIFCFASVERLGEQPCMVFSFNHCGCPIFQNKTNKAGDTVGAKPKKE